METVAIRMPKHPVALKLIEESGCLIAAPSANTSGKPSPTEASHVKLDLDGKIPMILDGGPVGIGIESTIIDLTEDTPMILRPGYITKEMLEEVLGEEVKIDPGIIASIFACNAFLTSWTVFSLTSSFFSSSSLSLFLCVRWGWGLGKKPKKTPPPLILIT